MPQVKDIKILNFNDKAYSVEDMSEAIQSLVYHYNNANKKEAELTDEIIIVRVAKEGILNQIRNQFDSEQKAAAEKAATDAATQAAASATPPAPVADVSETAPTVQ